MGIFNKMKALKDLVAAAPDLVGQAQELHNAQQAVTSGQEGAVLAEVDAELLEPIAGISLERYAALAKSVGERRLDQARIVRFIERQGHTVDAWEAAFHEWNARLKGDSNLAKRYGALYERA